MPSKAGNKPAKKLRGRPAKAVKEPPAKGGSKSKKGTKKVEKKKRNRKPKSPKSPKMVPEDEFEDDDDMDVEPVPEIEEPVFEELFPEEEIPEQKPEQETTGATNFDDELFPDDEPTLNEQTADPMAELELETKDLEDLIFEGEDVLPPKPAALPEEEVIGEEDDDLGLDFDADDEELPEDKEDEAEKEPEKPKTHFEAVLDSLKVRKRVEPMSEERKKEVMVDFVNRMHTAAAEDVEIFQRGGQANRKFFMIGSVLRLLMASDWHDCFVNNRGVHQITYWLTDLPGKVRPNMAITNALLKLLMTLPIGSHVLRSTNIGHAVRLIWLNTQESSENRMLANELTQKWIRNHLAITTSESRGRELAQEIAEEKGVAPVTKKVLSKAEIQARNEEIQQRRHPQMFGKPAHNFLAAPDLDRVERDRRQGPTRQNRIAKVVLGLGFAKNTLTKHENVSIGGGGMNVSFGN